MTEFIMENNVWLIIFGILIFMAMIGYTVEQKRESKKEEKEENKKDKKQELKIESTSDISVDDPIEPTSVPNILNMVETNNVENDSVQEETEAIPNNPIGLDTLMNPEINPLEENQNVNNVITETGEDLSVPLEEVTPTENLEAVSIEEIEKELSSETEASAPTIEENLTIIAEETTPSEETKQPETSTNANDLGMDDISYLFTENKKEENSSSEDVWKF